MSKSRTEDILQACPVVIARPVTWGAMDAYQHVNNTMYFRYFEDVRMAFFERVGIVEFMEAHDLGPILATTQCRFKAPLRYPDTVRVGTYISDIGEDRFTMQYVLVSERLRRVAAEGSGVIVSYDYRAERKCPLPEDWQRGLATGGIVAGHRPARGKKTDIPW